jgi:hypothetical protein
VFGASFEELVAFFEFPPKITATQEQQKSDWRLLCFFLCPSLRLAVVSTAHWAHWKLPNLNFSHISERYA